MTAPARTTEQRTASHRRLVTRLIINGLRGAFDGSYDRDRMFQSLKITPDFPLKQEDYPCIVVEYEPHANEAAGIGHEEWFRDETGVLRRWGHRRFEGTVTFNCMAMTPLDRDLMADAVEEVIAFGLLDDALSAFFYTIYGRPTDTAQVIVNQLAFNSDEIQGGGNSATLAPWSPEDQLVHETNLSCSVMGGFYNVVPQQEWLIVTSAEAQSYPQFEDVVTLPFADPHLQWSNPFVFVDGDTVTGTAQISAAESGP